MDTQPTNFVLTIRRPAGVDNEGRIVAWSRPATYYGLNHSQTDSLIMALRSGCRIVVDCYLPHSHWHYESCC